MMSTRTAIWIGLFVGSLIGGAIPELFGAGLLSAWAIVGNFAGGLIGIWIGYLIGNAYFS